MSVRLPGPGTYSVPDGTISCCCGEQQLGRGRGLAPAIGFQAWDGIVDTALGHRPTLVVLAEAGGAPVTGVEHRRDQLGVFVEAAKRAVDHGEQLRLGAERPVTWSDETCQGRGPRGLAPVRAHIWTAGDRRV
jgi:hypothetical protein